MSPSQTQLYWREWGKAVAYTKTNSLPAPDRHALHTQALGADKSSKQLTNADLDAVLAAFRAIYDPDNLAPQLRASNGRRARMLWVLRSKKVAELAEVLDAPEGTSAGDRLDRSLKYIARIMAEKFSAFDSDDLTDAQLQLLLMDVSRAISSRRAKRVTPESVEGGPTRPDQPY